MAINGNNIIIYSNITGTTKAIAATKANSITTDCGTIPIASPDTGDWEAKIAGRKSWSISTSFLVGYYSADNSAYRLLDVGKTIIISIRYRSASENIEMLRGTAIVKQCRIDAAQGNLVTGAFTFEGSGALERGGT